MALTEYTILDALLIFTVLVLLLFNYIIKSYSFWSRIGVYGKTPKFPFGSIEDVILKKKSNLNFWTDAYNDLKKKDKKFGGFYTFQNPVLLITDPELIKIMLVKDFDHFYDRGTYVDEKGDPLTAHLVNLRGEKWKNVRSKLTPTFSSGKLKSMFQILIDVSQELDKCLTNLKDDDVDIKHVLGRFTTDIIGNCAFGIECNSLKDPNVLFYTHAQRIFIRNFWKRMQITFSRIVPGLFKFFRIKIVDKDQTKFYMGLVRDVIELRKTTNIKRNDFMQLLIGLMDAPPNEALTFNQIAAQAFVFFLAGYETSATATTFTLYELAANPEIQEKLREEISMTKKKHGGLTYDSLFEMPYLDKVISESLRKYPPFPFTIRACTKEYTIPDTKVTLPVGTSVLVPIFPVHRDPEHYPNPELFDPERFSEENKKTRHGYSYLPFGEGPRICIGMRFALLVTKVGVAQLLAKYRFSVSPKTKSPMTFGEENLSLTAEGKIWLNVKEIVSK